MAVGVVASRKEADMDNLILLPCPHHNVVLDTTGGMQFSVGEVWDDILERLLCLDCMEYVTEADIHANQSPITNQTIQLEVHHDHA
jgi:hypothetical protein